MKTGQVKIADIIVGERFRKEYAGIQELAESIKTYGLIQPIAVRTTEAGLELLAGGRRMRAMKVMGLIECSANIYEGGQEYVDELHAREIEYEENMRRNDLTWDEEVALQNEIVRIKQDLAGTRKKGNQYSKETGGFAATDLAKMIGKSASSVRSDIQLAKAMELLPELKTAKNKSEAMKMLQNLGKQIHREKATAQVEQLDTSTTINLLRSRLSDSYVIGDAIAYLKSMKDNCADFIDLDPPYAIDAKDMKKHKHMKADVQLAVYNEVSKDVYPKFLSDVMKECFRILKPNGWIICWFAPEPWFEKVYATLEKAGFAGNRIPAIWTKRLGQTMRPEYYLSNDYEMFFYMRKHLSSIEKKGRSNIFDFHRITAHYKVHPTEKPIEMMVEILETFVRPSPDKLIVIPFMGSGNTALAAANLGMESIGCDLEQTYKDAYNEKIITQQHRRYKSYE